MMKRKGMTMALGVIIAIVVLIVVALAVIAITTGSINIFGSDTSTSIDKSGNKIGGSADCADCGWRETKGTESEIDDILHGNPYYCEDESANQFCCEDVTKTHCVSRSDCGRPFADRGTAETECRPA